MVLIEPHYLPGQAWFASVFHADKILIEENAPYVKQTFRNRCQILTPNGPVNLSIPVHATSLVTPYKEVTIDYRQGWVKDHWRAITSAYGKSPFFEYYQDYFWEIYDSKPAYLLDLNLEMLTLCLKALQLTPEILPVGQDVSPQFGEIDLRDVIIPRKSVEDYPFYLPEPYPQIFGKDFVPDLSVIDALFCEGPNARLLIKKSSIAYE